VILGASNVTRGLSTVIETLRLVLGSPLEIIAAIGHGRSYGTNSTVLIRTLPGILHCGFWKTLATSHQARRQLPTFALITDIGNDIMYGAPPQVIIQWVEECIDRLRATVPHVQIAMTATPIEGIRALKPWKYAIVKSILFPSRKLSFAQATERAAQLHDGLIELAVRKSVKMIELSPEWYGFDPIHIRMRWWSEAWLRILSKSFKAADETQTLAPARPSLLRWMKVRLMMPEHYWFAGVKRHTKQPAGLLANQTTVSLY
jgi:hypothetical protein